MYNPITRFIALNAPYGFGEGGAIDRYLGYGMGDGGFDYDDGDDWEVDAVLSGADDAFDDDEVLGASGANKVNSIAQLERKKTGLQMKLASARNPRQAARIRKDIDRIDRKIGQKQGKLGRQLGDQVRKGKISPTEAAAIAGAAGAGAGVIGATRFGTAFESGTIQQPGRPGGWYGEPPAPGLTYANRVERTPPAGQEVRIPLLISNSPVAAISIGTGTGVRTVAIPAQSAQITYAGFQVVGVECIVNVQANAEALINVLLSDFQVSGDKNLLYGAQNVAFAGQSMGAAPAGGRETISGLRDNPILQPNNTLSLNATFRQEADNPSKAIAATVQFAAVCIVTYDAQVR